MILVEDKIKKSLVVLHIFGQFLWLILGILVPGGYDFDEVK